LCNKICYLLAYLPFFIDSFQAGSITHPMDGFSETRLEIQRNANKGTVGADI
jgi:hypothetical protein